jgi:hypothetical protein
MNTATAIANHLQIAVNAIQEIQEWASVLWVRVRGMRPSFVSKKVVKKEVESMEKDYFYVEGGAFSAFSLDGNNWEGGSYSKTLRLAGPAILEAFSGISDHYHIQMAKDAGGVVISQTPNGYGGLREAVRVPLAMMQEFASRLLAAKNPREGMMQTSTGEWVFADDWDAIEGGR